MSKAATFSKEKVSEVEIAVCAAFDCSLSDVLSYKDTFFKKVAVYVLYKFYGFDWRLIGHHFQMTYLYVPTASDEMENMFLRVPGFRLKMIQVLKDVGYESTVEQRNALFVA